jgi:hypothetical protein
MGGDEFMLILPESSIDDVFRPIERMRGCEVPYEDNIIEVKFSVGWAQHRRGELPAELLRRADEALWPRSMPAPLPSPADPSEGHGNRCLTLVSPGFGETG